MPSSAAMPALPPGFRFHPTDEELIVHYLARQAASMPCPVPIIAEVNIYKCNPWDLPGKALFGENEWYFFSPRDRKYPNGARPNRAAGSGYWKATGTDKAILSTPASENIGVKKALVFYRGKPPKGVKTDWIMHEYRLTAADNKTNAKRTGSSSMRLDDWVLCRIHMKCISNLNNFSSSSDQEQEQESSTVEDSSHNNHTVSSPKSEALDGDGGDDQVQLQQFCPMAITKSCSITDLLNTVDYAELSQLLLDGGGGGGSSSSDAAALAAYQPPESPLIYGQPPWQTPNYTTNHVDVPQQVDDRDHANGNNRYNGMRRKRSSGSLYCNQLQQLPADQYSGMLIHPFLNQQLHM